MLGAFFPFWYFAQMKIWQPWLYHSGVSLPRRGNERAPKAFPIRQIIQPTRARCFLVGTRVARWFLIKRKIRIWVNFGKMLVYVMYGHLEHFRGIWDIL
jgi:hypothetical protein